MKKQSYFFPHESLKHEATWLQWPHIHTYGQKHQQLLQPIWVQMTKALCQGQIVRIIAYNEQHKTHVKSLLQGLPNIEYFVFPTDDVWVRDNGPIFAVDPSGKLIIQNWGFNGWGQKANFSKCDKIPQKIANVLHFQVVDLRDEMVNEGGSVETDGNGVMMVCESSTLNNNRNPGLKKVDAEFLFKKYYGVEKIIWLRGKTNEDITDCHIDGFVKFIDHKIMLTFSKQDLRYWGLQQGDIDKIYSAKNIENQNYKIIVVPLTKKQLTLKQSKQKLKGSYLNFYVGNQAVLVPLYNDENDGIALKMIQEFYPGRKVVGIQVTNLFDLGGMIHCVTQQQPVKNVVQLID